jgi:hypothetical protein
MITPGAAPRKDRISSASLLLIRVTAVLLGLMRSLPPGVAPNGAAEKVEPGGGGCDLGFVRVVGKPSVRKPGAQLLFDVFGVLPAVT